MGNFVIGKYTLESLTMGMYVSAMNLYREYVQNAVDSIDQAIRNGIIGKSDSKIFIRVSYNKRRIIIEDNGIGISRDNVKKVLMDIGNSEKRDSNSRGFRGIGRLAGISYCDELIFETSYFGEKEKCILKFDCKKLRELLIPGNNDEYDLLTLVIRVTEFKIDKEMSDKHYFKVCMNNVNNIDDILNDAKVEDYLVQVAPVAFSDEFEWKKKIYKSFKENGVHIDEYKIILENDDGEKSELHKRNTDSFFVDKIKKLSDKVKDIQVERIVDKEGVLKAILWYSVTELNGTIINDNIKGLRIRKGNMLVGDKYTLNSIFKESRFNGWLQGEVYVLDKDLIPNARRDNFEKNNVYIELIENLKIIGDNISKMIRRASTERSNLKNDKVSLEIVENELFEQESLNDINRETDLSFIDNKINNVFKKLDILSESDNIKKSTIYKVLNISDKFTIEQKKILEKVFSVITNKVDEKLSEAIIKDIIKLF